MRITMADCSADQDRRKVKGYSLFRGRPAVRSVDQDMPSYLVECYVPNSRSRELPETAARVREAAQALTAEGARVRYLRSTFLPSDELCLHLFEADSADRVGEASMRAGIQPERVVEAVIVACNDAVGGTPPWQHSER